MEEKGEGGVEEGEEGGLEQRNSFQKFYCARFNVSKRGEP